MAYGAPNGLQEEDVTTLINTQVGTANAPAVKTALNATGSAPIYAARAFVGFSGMTMDNIGGTYVRTGTTVVITLASSTNVSVGDYIYFDATSGTAADAYATVTAVSVDGLQVTFTHVTSGNTSGNCNFIKGLIRCSGNIAFVMVQASGVGFFGHFITPPPDTNYLVIHRADTATLGDIGQFQNASPINVEYFQACSGYLGASVANINPRPYQSVIAYW